MGRDRGMQGYADASEKRGNAEWLNVLQMAYEMNRK